MLCGPAAIDENIVLRPVRQIACYAAKVGKALLDGGEVHRVGQDGRRHRAGGQLGETVGRAAAIDEIVVAVGEAVAPRHHPQEIQRHVGGAADADGFAFEIAKARHGARGDEAKRRVGGGPGDDPDRRAVQDGAQRLIGRGLRDVQRAGGKLMQHARRRAHHEGVDAEVLGRVELLFRRDVMRQAEGDGAGDAEADRLGRARRAADRGGQDDQGAGDHAQSGTPRHGSLHIRGEKNAARALQHDCARMGTGADR